MKLAIVHDWFAVNSGAERCVEGMIDIWPDCDLFALFDFLNQEERLSLLKDKQVTTSFVQNLPFAKSRYRNYLPLFPYAVEQFDMRGYDVVISSSHAVAKGVLTTHDQIHIAYVYTPIRYVWDLYHQYLEESRLTKGFKAHVAKLILHYLRNWDAGTAHRPDYYIAISKYVAARIAKVYCKPSKVIYPPVNCDEFVAANTKESYYFTASRMVPYKKVDLIVEAFRNMPDKKLLVSGDGPDFKRLKTNCPRNVELLGHLPKEKLKDTMAKSRAFIFAAEEDFGIAPVEAQACGVPVIAFGKGGVTETVVGNFAQSGKVELGNTGLFFDRQNVECLQQAIRVFENNEDKFEGSIIRRNALRFSRERFEFELKSAVENIVINHRKQSL